MSVLRIHYDETEMTSSIADSDLTGKKRSQFDQEKGICLVEKSSIFVSKK